MGESEPLIRVMALHALMYCERLFYLEEVEEVRVADASVYAGRRLHEECRMTRRELERMRWELEKELSEEDSLMIAGLCAGCHSKVIARNTRNEYLREE